LRVLDEISQQVKDLDRMIEEQCLERYPAATQLRQIAGVGALTALSFALHIDNPHRFKNVRNVGAYLGLVPRRDQSGKTDKQLPISKTGNTLVRTLLVQAAQYILGAFGPDCDLRDYELKLAKRGGKCAKKKAIVATARKLAVVMLTMWQQQSNYQPRMNAETA